MESSGKSKGMIKIGILLSSSVQMTILAVAATIPAMIAHFTGANPTTIQTLITIPSLVSIPVNLIVGALSSRIGKKMPLIIGLLIMGVGGLLPAFVNVSLGMLTGCVVAFGFGLGMVIPTSTGLITDHFHGPEAGALMGMQSAFINMGTMILSLIGGQLAVGGWRNAFFVYFYILAMAAVVLFTIPKDNIQSAAAGAAKAKVKLSKEVYMMSAFILFYGLFFGVFNTNSGLLIEQKGIGDVTTTGTNTSLMTGIGILVGIMYGRISGIFKGLTLGVGAGLVAVGFLGLYLANSVIMLYAFTMLTGVGFSMVMPTGMFRASASVDQASSTMAISIYLACVNIGMFLTQYVMNPLASTIFGNELAASRFMLSGIGLAALALFGFLTRPKPTTVPDEKLEAGQ